MLFKERIRASIYKGRSSVWLMVGIGIGQAGFPDALLRLIT
jgi:hypothetical protein